MGLFSTTHIHQAPRTQHVPYCKEVKITEHRAPTDESIALLNEMQQKAEANIISSISVDDNSVKFVALSFNNPLAIFEIQFYLKMLVNGKEYRFTGTLGQKDLFYNSTIGYNVDEIHRNIVNIAREKFAEVIVNELFKNPAEILSTIYKAKER